jgi:hypothetical protein
MIWRLCLPSRVFELDFPHQDGRLVCSLWEAEPPCWQSSSKVTGANRAGPVIARVCREARNLALESGGPQDVPDEHAHPDASAFAYDMATHHTWLDAQRDTVHMNWLPEADIEWMMHSRGDPLRCLGWWAAKTRPGQPPSIMLDLLQSYQYRDGRHGDDPDQPHPSYRWTRPQLAETMRGRAEWQVVTGPPAVVHVADKRTAAGPFGLLADAPIQLVDLDDKLGLDRIWALGSLPNVSITAMFGRDDLDFLKGQVKEATEAVFGSLQAAPRMRPVMMFRLCCSGCQTWLGNSP